MDVRILYLDIDDEIATDQPRPRGRRDHIAMVLPYGSRVATSRAQLPPVVARCHAQRRLPGSSRATRRLGRWRHRPGADLQDGGGVRVVLRRRDGSGSSAGDAPGAVAGAAAAAAVTPSRSPRGSGGQNPRGEISSGLPAGSGPSMTPRIEVGAAGARWGRDRGRWHRGRRRDVRQIADDGAASSGVETTDGASRPASIPAARVVADTPADAIPAAGSRVRPAPAGPLPLGHRADARRHWPGRSGARARRPAVWARSCFLPPRRR